MKYTHRSIQRSLSSRWQRWLTACWLTSSANYYNGRNIAVRIFLANFGAKSHRKNESCSIFPIIIPIKMIFNISISKNCSSRHTISSPITPFTSYWSIPFPMAFQPNHQWKPHLFNGSTTKIFNNNLQTMRNRAHAVHSIIAPTINNNKE